MHLPCFISGQEQLKVLQKKHQASLFAVKEPHCLSTWRKVKEEEQITFRLEYVCSRLSVKITWGSKTLHPHPMTVNQDWGEHHQQHWTQWAQYLWIDFSTPFFHPVLLFSSGKFHKIVYSNTAWAWITVIQPMILCGSLPISKHLKDSLPAGLWTVLDYSLQLV